MALLQNTYHDSTQHVIVKRKRNLPGTPDPEAEVIALSPKTLMATNRFLCEVCGKGFQRDQNLQLHRRGHNLPWKLKQRSGKEPRKRVYVCPENNCVHHNPTRALGDLTGIKKHFCRKHGEKKWKCDKCSKKYAVKSDWKAHSKTCGTREYRCDCGVIFSRRDSFITHRAFCDALAEETARMTAVNNNITPYSDINSSSYVLPQFIRSNIMHDNIICPELSLQGDADQCSLLNSWYHQNMAPTPKYSKSIPSLFSYQNSYNGMNTEHANTSATALLQKAVQFGVASSVNPYLNFDLGIGALGETRDFLGVGGEQNLCSSSLHGWI